jgi:hypothetical protein
MGKLGPDGSARTNRALAEANAVMQHQRNRLRMPGSHADDAPVTAPLNLFEGGIVMKFDVRDLSWGVEVITFPEIYWTVLSARLA